jgi:dihydrofolate reductase
MRKLSVFNFVTLNGYFKGPNGDISWHRHGGEEAEGSEQPLPHDLNDIKSAVERK